MHRRARYCRRVGSLGSEYDCIYRAATDFVRESADSTVRAIGSRRYHCDFRIGVALDGAVPVADAEAEAIENVPFDSR